MELPQEILDLIIQHLNDDPATLKACTLAHSAFVPQCQRHLFSHIRLPPHPTKAPAESPSKLWCLFQRSQHLASYVSSLEIVDGHLHDSPVLDNEYLPRVLDLLSETGHLRSLTIQRPTSNRTPIIWRNLPLGLQFFLVKAVRDLTSLSLNNIQCGGPYFQLFLNTPQRLEKLAFYSTLMDPEQHATSSSPNATLMPAAIRTPANCLDVLLKEQRVMNTRRLKILEALLQYPAEYAQIWKLVRFNAIEDLILFIGPRGTVLPIPVDVGLWKHPPSSVLPRLRTIKIQTWPTIMNPFRWLFNFLRSTLSSTVQSIEAKVYVWDGWESSTEDLNVLMEYLQQQKRARRNLRKAVLIVNKPVLGGKPKEVMKFTAG